MSLVPDSHRGKTYSFRPFPEDFNKRILTELSENQLVDLHKEAMELFETYLKANAVHKVGVKEDLVRQIASSELFDTVIDKKSYNSDNSTSNQSQF